MKIEACRLLTVFEIAPLFDVMIRPVDDKHHPVHVTAAGIDVRPVFEFEDEFVCIASGDQNDPRCSGYWSWTKSDLLV
jgi:hypothetical protein